MTVARLAPAAYGRPMHDGDDLIPDLYAELRALAHARMRRLGPGQTLQPTELVHEVYLRLADQPGWNHRGHFFGAAAHAMRRVIVDRARRRNAQRRGGDAVFVEPLTTLPDPASGAQRAFAVEDVLALDRALAGLERDYPRKAQVVQMRCFGGFTREQMAEALGVDARTIDRDWRFARAWLGKALAEAPAGEDPEGA